MALQGQRFHHVCGLNVAMDSDRILAKWVPKQSGGSMFSEEPLSRGEIVHIEVKGSGHVELGIIRNSARDLGKGVFLPTRDLSDFKMLNEIRLHKRACKIRVSLDKDGGTVSSSYNDKSFVQNIEGGNRVWLAADVRFGDIEFKFVRNSETNRTATFSSSHGPNISLSDRNTTASTIEVNPGTICFKETPLRQGEQLRIECSPIVEGAGTKPPSRFHLSICTSNENPLTHRSRCETNFTLQAEKLSDLNTKEIEKLVKEDCNGNIDLRLDANNVVSYTSASGKNNEQKVDVLPSGEIWLVFKLYRVEVKLFCYSEDVPDAVRMETDDGYLRPVAAKTTVKRIESESYMDITGGQGATNLTQYSRSFSSSSSEATSPKTTYPSSTPQFGLETTVEQLREEVESLKANQRTRQQSTTALPMNESDEKVDLSGPIRRSFAYLVSSLTLDTFLDYLYQYEVVTDSEYDHVRAKARDDRAEGIRILLGILKRKPVSRHALTNALEKSNQIFLLEKFLPQTP